MAAELKDPANELRGLEGRVPPQDLDTEAVVLSELMVNPDSFDRVITIIKANHFYSDANKLIFECVIGLQERGDSVDVVAIARFAKEKHWLDRMGGTPYLTQIAQATPVAANMLEQHAKSIKDLWRRRAAIAYGHRIVAEGYSDVGSEQEWIEAHEQMFSGLAHDHSANDLEPVGDIAARQFKRMYDDRASGMVTGIPTGFTKLDWLMSGLHPGDLYILAARPGMGKTALLGGMLRSVSQINEDYPDDTLGSVMFSLEQPKEQIAMRLLCAEGRASFARMRRNQLHQDDYDKLNDAIGNLSIPLYIDDTPAITILELRAKVRKLQKQIESGKAPIRAKRLGVIGVDYIQLMRAEKEIRSKGNRELEVSSFSQGLKNLAKELGIAVIALSQLNRNVEKRPDQRPMLSDLRESGAIEQDADAIIFLYRDSYYKKTVKNNKTELIVAKQRNGPTDTVHVAFEEEYMLFRNLSMDEDKRTELSDDEVNQDGSF